ncbi:MAG: hypothetical protein ABIH74_02685 [Candidatus Omnitrophota bacterium]
MCFYRLICISVICLFLAGCADVTLPPAKKFFKDPLGTGSLKLGMSKNQVASIYGEPNTKRMVTAPEWSEPREEWLYRAAYSTLPVNVGFLAADMYLYFDGENLTNIRQEPFKETESTDDDEHIK